MKIEGKYSGCDNYIEIPGLNKNQILKDITSIMQEYLDNYADDLGHTQSCIHESDIPNIIEKVLLLFNSTPERIIIHGLHNEKQA